MDAPPVQYVKTSDGFRIACMAFGEGPPLLWLNTIPSAQSIELIWKLPWIAAALEHVSQSRTVILYDCRGCGMSSRDAGWLTLNSLMLDIDAVLTRFRAERLDLLGAGLGGVPLAAAYAGKHPERVRRLVLLDPLMRDLSQSPAGRSLQAAFSQDWRLFTETTAMLTTGLTNDSASQYSELFRASVNRTTALHYFAFFDRLEIGDMLARIRARTLVIHHRNDRLASLEAAATIVEEIQDARLLTFDETESLDRVWGDAIATFLEADQMAEGPPAAGLAKDSLSARELDVVRLIATGRSNQQIADELVISRNTARKHVANILDKTGTANRTEAAGYARDHGLA